MIKEAKSKNKYNFKADLILPVISMKADGLSGQIKKKLR